MRFPKLLFCSAILVACNPIDDALKSRANLSVTNYSSPAGSIGEIPLPDDYKRVTLDRDSFGSWLRNTRLKSNPRIYLHTGKLKPDQSQHYGVLDIKTGKKDLQQCADAVMRLRAEYLFAQKRYDEIAFLDNHGKPYLWQGRDDRGGFESYLEKVFTYCNSASLQTQLRKVPEWKELISGDILIEGGFPGHAMIIVDVAQNAAGNKIFLLAQSFMPAQDIHIVKDLSDDAISPWYDAGEFIIDTPGWTFNRQQLYRF